MLNFEILNGYAIENAITSVENHVIDWNKHHSTVFNDHIY